MLECFFLLLLCRWTISWVITPWRWAMLRGMATSSLDMYITEVHQHPMTINITPATGGGSGSTPTMPIPTASQEPWLEGLISLTSSVICVTIIITPSQLWLEMLDWLQHLYPWQPLLAMALTKIPYLQRFLHSIHRPHHPHHPGSHNRQMQKSQCSHCYFICYLKFCCSLYKSNICYVHSQEIYIYIHLLFFIDNLMLFQAILTLSIQISMMND